MLRWLIALFIMVVAIGVLAPRLARWLRLGYLPGDFGLRWRGREYRFPFASTILLSLILTLLLKYL